MSLGAAVLLAGVTAPLSITKGNEVVGGNATLFALWGLIGAALITWAMSTDRVAQRLVNAAASVRSLLPSVKINWKPPARRLSLHRSFDEKTARRLVEAGRTGERLAQGASAAGIDVETSEVGPRQVAFRLRSKPPVHSPEQWSPPVSIEEFERYLAGLRDALQKHGFGDYAKAVSTESMQRAAHENSPLPSDHEALELWMDQEAIPDEMRSRLRSTSAELMQEVAAERAPEHLKHSEEARTLREHGEVLERLLWEHRRTMVRSTKFSIPGPRLPQGYTGEVEAWNKRVLALADRTLSVKDAGAAVVYPKLSSLLGFGPSVEQLDELFKDNLSVLARIETMR